MEVSVVVGSLEDKTLLVGRGDGAGVANDEVGTEYFVPGGSGRFGVDAFEKHFRSAATHFLFGLVNRGEGHGQVLDEAEVVESYDGEVLGNPEAQRASLLHEHQGHMVVAA